MLVLGGLAFWDHSFSYFIFALWAYILCYYGAELVFMDFSFARLVGKALKLTQIIMLASDSPVAKIFYLCLKYLRSNIYYKKKI